MINKFDVYIDGKFFRDTFDMSNIPEGHGVVWGELCEFTDVINGTVAELSAHCSAVVQANPELPCSFVVTQGQPSKGYKSSAIHILSCTCDQKLTMATPIGADKDVCTWEAVGLVVGGNKEFSTVG